jgi:tripartite-type tricarboxylate transporter receptor subunit TctC
MKAFRRLICLAALSFAALPWAAHAADYSGNVRILVGFPPGGATDVVARILSDKLNAVMGQPFFVDNKPGAGGMIATQQLKAAPPDGSTIMLTIDHSQVIVPLTFKAPGYDPLKDFTPLAGVATYYNVMAVSGALPVKTPAELGAWLKAHPGDANYGIPAVGSVPQFAGLLVGKALGTNMVPVSYRGGAPLVTDLIANHVPVGFLSLTETIDYHRAGKMRVPAVSGTSRAKSAPDIPTFEELGIKGIDKNPWLAFFGPKGMPKEFTDRFTRAVATVLADPEVVEKLSNLGDVPAYAPPGELQDWVSSATAHWGKVIKDSGYELQ